MSHRVSDFKEFPHARLSVNTNLAPIWGGCQQDAMGFMWNCAMKTWRIKESLFFSLTLFLQGYLGLMEASEYHLTCFPHLHALRPFRSVPSARMITPATDPPMVSTATVPPQRPSPLPEVPQCMTAKDCVPCLSRPLSLAIYPALPTRVMLGFVFTRLPTACTVIHSLPHLASPRVRKRWPPLPLPLTRVTSWARLPVGRSRTTWACSAGDSRASCLTLGL